MIDFRNVSVRYRRAPQLALSQVSFSATTGAVTAIVGPNGSGKSTLVRALLRRIPLETGSILMGGIPIDRVSRRALARQLAIVTQREESHYAQPVRDAVALGRYPHQGHWRAALAEDDAAVQQGIELAGIGDLADRSTAELSGGEWQRVRLARALAQGGSALVLDEPTTFLDVSHEMAAFELLATLARGGTAVLVVSHQLNLVARFADAIIVLNRGEVVASGSPDDVMQASVLESVYEWPLVIVRDPAVGAPALIPLRSRSWRGDVRG
ncbi:MAG: ABC transporter ATP-binding protein [Anaerolineae bacterium]|nr:ABC transporter ATP-binding protein [Gemmatimonadaceae bacterium]